MSKDSRVHPKKPEQEWLNQYFSPGLLSTAEYHLDTPKVKVKLDQNESPWDWTDDLKEKILEKVKLKSWNRYPESHGDALQRLLSEYVGVPAECLLTGPGSNHIISLIINDMARNVKGKVVIAQPTFALFEMYCKFADIQYETWKLNQDFEYELANLPELPAKSLVIFASPNNPTGTSLDIDMLRQLLLDYPDSLFLADEAYFEFNDQPYIDLLRDHSNLMILRTMSKTMGAAGVRLGYLIASEAIIAQLRKVRMPFLLNHFAMEAANVMLSDPEIQTFIQGNIDNAISERERVRNALKPLGQRGGFRVIPSLANFLLVQWDSQKACQRAYENMIEYGVLVRNVSKGPGLNACLRVSIGTQKENNFLIKAIESTL